MAEYVPLHDPGEAVTYTTSAAVTGGMLLAVTGDRTVAQAAAGSAVFVGVAAHDAPSGGRVTVYHAPGQVHVHTAAAIITAGAPLKTAATSQLTPYVVGTDPVTQLIGYALTAAAATAACTWKAVR